MYFLFHKLCQSPTSIRSQIIGGGFGGEAGAGIWGQESLSFPEAQVEIKGILRTSIHLGTFWPFDMFSYICGIFLDPVFKVKDKKEKQIVYSSLRLVSHESGVLEQIGRRCEQCHAFWTVRTLLRDSPFPYRVVERFPGCLAPWPGSLAFLEALDTTHIFLIKSFPAYTS